MDDCNAHENWSIVFFYAPLGTKTQLRIFFDKHREKMFMDSFELLSWAKSNTRIPWNRFANSQCHALSEFDTQWTLSSVLSSEWMCR